MFAFDDNTKYHRGKLDHGDEAGNGSEPETPRAHWLL